MTCPRQTLCRCLRNLKDPIVRRPRLLEVLIDRRCGWLVAPAGGTLDSLRLSQVLISTFLYAC